MKIKTNDLGRSGRGTNKGDSMLIKVSEASGVVLDWMVAKCEGVNPYMRHGRLVWMPRGVLFGIIRKDPQPVAYSTDPSQSFPIIDREQIATTTQHGCRGMELWMASLVLPNDNGVIIQWGPTMPIAAMRCFVASKMGEEVDVPEELL